MNVEKRCLAIADCVGYAKALSEGLTYGTADRAILRESELWGKLLDEMEKSKDTNLIKLLEEYKEARRESLSLFLCTAMDSLTLAKEDHKKIGDKDEEE